MAKAGWTGASVLALMLVGCGSGGSDGADEPDTSSGVSVRTDLSSPADEVRAPSSPSTETVAPPTSTDPPTTVETTTTVAPTIVTGPTTVAPVDPVQVGIDGGFAVGRVWADDGEVIAHLVRLGDAMRAVGVLDGVPADAAARALELAAAAGRPAVGLGATSDDELSAVAGLVGAPVGDCTETAPPADGMCARIVYLANSGRQTTHVIFDHGIEVGVADVNADETGTYRVAMWAPAEAGSTGAGPAAPAAPAQPTAPTVDCEMEPDGVFVGHFPMEVGSSGGRVREVQDLLVILGLDIGPSGADGSFGPDTEQAVRDWQARGGFQVTGVVCMEEFFAMVTETESDSEGA